MTSQNGASNPSLFKGVVEKSNGMKTCITVLQIPVKGGNSIFCEDAILTNSGIR